MSRDRRILNLVAAVLCGIGSAATLVSSRLRHDRAGALSGLFGLIGSVAWVAAAFDDLAEARRTEHA